MKTLIAALALVALAATGCDTSSDSNDSATNDFGDPDPSVAQQVTTLVPQGGSTTQMLPFTFPITASRLEIHTNCNLQLAQVYVTYVNGGFAALGSMVPTSSSNVWATGSGLKRTFTHIQLVTNNFGAPAYCTYTVKGADAL